MRHLDAELYAQIRDRPESVPGDVCNHLREECPECAAFLASLPPEQRDHRILRLLKEPEPPPLSPFSLRPEGGPGPRLPIAALGIVALVLAAGGVEAFFVHRTRVGPRPVMTSIPPVEIAVTVHHADGGEAKAAPDAVLSPSDKLTAQAKLERNAYVSLVRAGDNAGFEAIVLNDRAKTAVVDFASDAGIPQISLENLSGTQHVLALTCDRPIAIDEAISAAKETVPPGLGMAEYTFQVR